MFASIYSDLLYQITPILDSLNILLYNVEETEGNICNSHVIFLNSIIYSQFHFFLSYEFNVHKTLNLKPLYLIYSEGRYGDFLYNMINKSDYLAIFNIIYYQLKQDLSNVQEVVNILNAETKSIFIFIYLYLIAHIIIHGTQGKCSTQFFKLYHGNANLESFISFSHSSPYKYFAYNININNFYFISLYSNTPVDESEVPIEYYKKFNSKYAIDYRIGKNTVTNIINAMRRCTSYYSSEYKKCFSSDDVEEYGTAIGSNHYILGFMYLYIFNISNNNIITFLTSPFVENTFAYNFTTKTVEICEALESKTSPKLIAHVYIIFPSDNEDALNFYYSLFNIIQDMYITGMNYVVPKLYYNSCKMDDYDCIKAIFDKSKEVNSKISFILLPLTYIYYIPFIKYL